MEFVFRRDFVYVEINENYKLPLIGPSCSNFFNFNILRTVSTSKMDIMLTSGSPWEFIDPINLEELKIPRCADHFIRLLDAIKERYCNLPQPRHQYVHQQFVN